MDPSEYFRVFELFLIPVRKTLAKGQKNIVPCGHPGKKTVILKHDAPLKTGAENRLPIHRNGTLYWLLKPRKQAEKGAFPASGLTEQTHKFAGRYFKTDIL